MNKILVLDSKNYPDSNTVDYGDCIIIDSYDDVVVYDCGSSEHAYEVLNYMVENNIKNVTVILSHNDDDHFKGIPTLIKLGVVKSIKTFIPWYHTDDILKRLEKPLSRAYVERRLKEMFSNISTIDEDLLEDIYENRSYNNADVICIGPDYDYVIDALVKRLNSEEGDQIDGESITNATSIQVSVKMSGYNVLLTGDSTYESIDNIVRDYEYVQLPHHGKSEIAEQIWKKKTGQINHMYFISDNKGNNNGGSEDTKTRGHIVKNTRTDGTIQIDDTSYSTNLLYTGRTLGVFNEGIFTI